MRCKLLDGIPTPRPSRKPPRLSKIYSAQRLQSVMLESPTSPLLGTWSLRYNSPSLSLSGKAIREVGGSQPPVPGGYQNLYPAMYLNMKWVSRHGSYPLMLGRYRSSRRSKQEPAVGTATTVGMRRTRILGGFLECTWGMLDCLLTQKIAEML